jgi:hypothetical protein
MPLPSVKLKNPKKAPTLTLMLRPGDTIVDTMVDTTDIHMPLVMVIIGENRPL